MLGRTSRRWPAATGEVGREGGRPCPPLRTGFGSIARLAMMVPSTQTKEFR